jgi:hypothetical protein
MTKSRHAQSKAKSSPQKARQTPKKKERGIWLTIALVLIMIHSILTIFVYLRYTNNPQSSFTPWVVTSLFIVAVAKFVAAAALWMWERWGIYLFLGASLVMVAIGLVLTGSLLVGFNEIIPVAVLAWLMRDRMQDFK